MEYPEAALFSVLADCLSERGFTIYSEVPCYSSPLDLVAVKPGWLYPVIVELKTSFTEKLLRQAMLAQLSSAAVFACAGTKPGKRALEMSNSQGLGLMSIRNGRVHLVTRPMTRRRGVYQPMVDRLKETLSLMEPGGIGGVPTMKGVGPGVDVFFAVKEYRGLHPRARWKEIFEAVPNHYGTARSLAQSMNKRGDDGRLVAWAPVLEEVLGAD